jgi:hypothetical protein
MYFEVNFLTAFHFNWHWTRVMDSCEFKVTHGGGEIPSDYMELVLSIFFTLIKYMREAKVLASSPSNLIYPFHFHALSFKLRHS